MKLAITVLMTGFVVFGLGAIMLFLEARSNTAVLRGGIGLVTLVNAEWVALLLLAAVSGSTALILAYLSKAVDVLALRGERPDSAVDQA
jgi:hypothetical protein